MRSFRVFALVLAVALLAASPAAFASVSSSDLAVSADVLSSTPSKVCHPKKPVTCRAADLSVAIADVAIASEATDSRLAPQEAVVCMPPRWECRANTLPTDIMKIELSVKETAALEPQEPVVCMPPRWECRANTLG